MSFLGGFALSYGFLEAVFGDTPVQRILGFVLFVVGVICTYLSFRDQWHRRP
jgi:hypothetical protein